MSIGSTNDQSTAFKSPKFGKFHLSLITAESPFVNNSNTLGAANIAPMIAIAPKSSLSSAFDCSTQP